MRLSHLFYLLSASVLLGHWSLRVHASPDINIDNILLLKHEGSAHTHDTQDTRFYHCPLPCDNRDSSQWTVYPSVGRLGWCDQPMLFDFAIHTNVRVHQDAFKLRACTAGNFYVGSSQDEASEDACSVSAEARKATLSLGYNTSSDVLGTYAIDDAINSIDKLSWHLPGDHGKCEASIRFGYSNGTITGLYAGSSFSKTTIGSISTALSTSLKYRSSVGTAVTQLCGDRRNANQVFGIIVSSAGDLAKVQEAVATWSKADCVSDTELSHSLKDVQVWENPSDHRPISMELRGLEERSSCKTISVESGDSCGKLASRCKISGSQFTEYNKDKDLCSKLQPDQRVCCSAGTLPDIRPKTQADGTCAVHHVIADDNCSKLAGKYGVSVKDIEGFNKGTTWGWSGCSSIMIGTDICVSKGDPPLPASVENAICGPTKPGTKRPEKGTKIADLNPCPLNACCNIWGQCGTTKDFCVEKKGPTGNPGTAPKGVNGCVANCGTKIVNKVSPSSFGHIGYYESWNGDRDCLKMDAADATRNGKYNVIHWAFAEINADDWTVVIKDKHNQWDGFAKLQNAKKVIAFGGWAYSTDAATYDILRQAMTPEHRETFAKNVAKFLNDKKIDGVDFDWEYPGADVPGTPMGKSSDGPNYLAFLKVLRKELGDKKTLSIAAPASYFYLKAFPIKDMAKELDYIVYMTYDLHGQWDAGSKWSQEGCLGGNCLRSHVNLTETTTALVMITKAGVPTNKIYVGESSYGRSFKMSKAGCTDAKCTFLGTNTKSEAKPGRCTKTAGYISNAEIDEIISKGKVKTYHDGASNSDILVYADTEWVAYMSDTTKGTRRSFWESNKFAGTVDWAVDLQTFHPTPPKDDDNGDSTSTTSPAPATVPTNNSEEDDAQKYKCGFFDPPNWELTRTFCQKPCADVIAKAKEEDDTETTNYGCVGNYPVDEPIPYIESNGVRFAPGVCICNNPLANKFVDVFLEAMAAIAQIGCFILMQAFNFILNIAVDLVPGGVALKTGLQGIVNAASYVDYTYDADNDPQGAFDFFLSPCGGTNLVPDDLKKGFDIAIGAAGGKIRGVKIDTPPKPKWEKGSGKKGDKGNKNNSPKSTKKDDEPTKTTTDHGPTTAAACKRAAGDVSRKDGNELISEQCKKGTTTTTTYTITSLSYGPTPTVATGVCSDKWSQACYHYSSAIKVNPTWATLSCPQAAATPSRKRTNFPAQGKWRREHRGGGWTEPQYRRWQGDCHADEYPPAYLLEKKDDTARQGGKTKSGQLIRYLPDNQNTGAASMWRSMCFEPFFTDTSARDTKAYMTEQELYNTANGKGGKLKRFGLKTDHDHKTGPKDYTQALLTSATDHERYSVGIHVDFKPFFTIDFSLHKPDPSDPEGHEANECWPNKIARKYRGFTLLQVDPSNEAKGNPYDFTKDYKYKARAKGNNGSSPQKRGIDLEDNFVAATNGTLDDHVGRDLEDLEDGNDDGWEDDDYDWEDDYDEDLGDDDDDVLEDADGSGLKYGDDSGLDI